MIAKDVPTTHLLTNGTARAPKRRPPMWRRKRVIVIVLGVLVLGAIVLRLVLSQPAPSPASPAPVAAPLVAHGQLLPARQAHVGTQAGGVVQRLDVKPGAEVAAQTPLAWMVTSGGTEIVTAPFAGTITNVLVDAGDTLVPGATIAVLADLHTLQVETSDVDEFLVSSISVGQHVQLNIDALDNLALSGTVTNVALLPQSGTSGTAAYPVIISVSDLPAKVHAGMSVRVTFPATQ